MKRQLTLIEAKFLADKAENLFQQAASAWERGNNSGNNAALTRGNKRCEALRNKAEAILKPFGIEVDYPGLYPSFQVKGFNHYTPLSAISAALEK